MTSGPNHAVCLQAHDIVAGYGNDTVLRGVTFEVPSDGLTLVAGTNGSGKSTLARVLAGAHAPIGGTVTCKDGDITRFSRRERLRLGIGYVRQEDAVFPDLNVRENLLCSASAVLPHTQARTALDALIHSGILGELSERMTDKAGTLSSGLKRLLAISMGLVQRPKLMILDEPAAGLAADNSGRVFKLLRTAQKDFGIALVIIEQRIEMVLHACDHVCLLLNGTLAVRDDLLACGGAAIREILTGHTTGIDNAPSQEAFPTNLSRSAEIHSKEGL